MPMISKIVKFAKSPAGQRLIMEATIRAKDPKTRAQVQAIAKKVAAARRGRPIPPR